MPRRLGVLAGHHRPQAGAGNRRRPAPPPGASVNRRQAVNAQVCTVDVPNADAAVEAALAAGGAIAMAKMAVPGVGWLAYVKDTEGNILGVMQTDSAAA